MISDDALLVERCLRGEERAYGILLGRYRRVLVPEMNLGQLVRLLRAEYLVDAIGFNKIQGRPFKVSEIAARCLKLLNGAASEHTAA